MLSKDQSNYKTDGLEIMNSMKMRRRGRPADERARRSVLDAANQFLARRGYTATTIDAIAERAGVGKATIYRVWGSKAAVVIDAFLSAAKLGVQPPNSGAILTDLRVHLLEFVRVLGGSTGKKLKAILGEAQNDPDLEEAFRARIWSPGRAGTVAAIKRGIAEGKIRPGVDPQALLDAFYGAVYYRLLIGHAPLDKTFANHLFDVTLRGMQRTTKRAQ